MKETMQSKFYVVEKNGIPAVWQSSPDRIERMLKHKQGFANRSDAPSNTRAEALIRLRQLFPESRPLKEAKTDS
jgi:hypothetical protein